jgi:hypothetical protein
MAALVQARIPHGHEQQAIEESVCRKGRMFSFG